ncbi:uncharacterized protein LOC121408581 [Lytechinus variegatus]|uniref:uncharacterized protein LOC121408581 n=1 Tax=Lytechinus variegatus TaxID=7654 RepID=UPI001BB23E36|nr:uncharacterized protein LOC121408581 [Lytechinus variegatus]
MAVTAAIKSFLLFSVFIARHIDLVHSNLYGNDVIDYKITSGISTTRNTLKEGKDPTPPPGVYFDEEADRRWAELRAFPYLSFEDETSTDLVSCRTFYTISQKRLYKWFRETFAYDALVTDQQTGFRVMAKSTYTRDAAVQDATNSMVNRLVFTGHMKESTNCFLPAYSSPLLLIQGTCPPNQGIKCDTVCVFACSDSSFTMVGSSTIKCRPNGTLSNEFPHCQAKEQPTTHTATTAGTNYSTKHVHTSSTPSETTTWHNDPTMASPITKPSPSIAETTPAVETDTTIATNSSVTPSTKNHTTKGNHTPKTNPTTATTPKADPITTDSSTTQSHSSRKTGPTTALPGTSHKLKTMGFIGFLGLPLLILPLIYIIYKLRHRHSRKQYTILDEDSVGEDDDDVPPDVDGFYQAEKIRSATITEIGLNREECYPMDQRDKGIVFILNNYTFHTDRTIERKGSDVDMVNVKHVFTEIGYTSNEAQNLTAEGIRRKLKSLKQKISPSHTSVVLVFMSHGVSEGILGIDQKVVTVEEIKNMFSGNNCPALIGKPKIMFFQACRGDKATPSAPSPPNYEEDPGMYTDTVKTDGVDGGVTMVTREGECVTPPPTLDAGELDIDGSVPDNADVYIAHATSEGYFSLRHKQNGSWFIQALCEELIASAHAHHLDDIMTKVTDRVKRQEARILVQGRRRLTLQTPQIIKQGIGKKIFFLPKYQPPSDSQ